MGALGAHRIVRGMLAARSLANKAWIQDWLFLCLVILRFNGVNRAGSLCVSPFRLGFIRIFSWYGERHGVGSCSMVGNVEASFWLRAVFGRKGNHKRFPLVATACAPHPFQRGYPATPLSPSSSGSFVAKFAVAARGSQPTTNSPTCRRQHDGWPALRTRSASIRLRYTTRPMGSCVPLRLLYPRPNPQSFELRGSTPSRLTTYESSLFLLPEIR